MSFLDFLLLAGWLFPVLVIGGFAVFAVTLVERRKTRESLRTVAGSAGVRASDRDARALPVPSGRPYDPLLHERSVLAN